MHVHVCQYVIYLYSLSLGAFFIPYLLFLLLCGVPLFFMEASYGQFSSLSPISVWRMCPLFKGGVLYRALSVLIKKPSTCQELFIVLCLLCCLGIANLNCDVGPMLHILPRTTKNEYGNRIEVGSQEGFRN